jgi:hypothetical protein
VKRLNVNAAVDAIAFAGFVFLTATGVLMRYVLPPGSGWHTTVWGLSRHAWAEIHYWIAAVFLATLTLHLVLHRRWIVSLVRRRPQEGSGIRVALGFVGFLAILGIAFAPFVSPVEQTPHGPGSRGLRPRDIQGSMTLRQVADGTGLPFAKLITGLGLPPDTSPDTTIDQLTGEHGLRLRDIRQVVRESEAPSDP